MSLATLQLFIWLLKTIVVFVFVINLIKSISQFQNRQLINNLNVFYNFYYKNIIKKKKVDKGKIN